MTNTGFVDAHVHLRDAAVFADAARAGITAMRDAGTRDGAALELLRTRDSSALPAVVTAGSAISRKGGYGERFGIPVETVDEARSEILRLKTAGAGIIKVMASGMVSLKRPGEITAGGFDREELRDIVEEAGRLGLGVMAHANGEAAIMAAARAGVRSIEHGFFMTDHALSVMEDHRVFWIPTVGALHRAAESDDATAEAMAFVAKTISRHLEMIGLAFSRGVPLAIGTDCVLPDPRYRETYEAELGFFRQAGIPPDDVLRIAREGGANLLGVIS